jgi:hypothetical protein
MHTVNISREAKLAIATLLADNPPGAKEDLLLLYEVLALFEEIGETALARFEREELKPVRNSHRMHLKVIVAVIDLLSDGRVLTVVSVQLKS